MPVRRTAILRGGLPSAIFIARCGYHFLMASAASSVTGCRRGCVKWILVVVIRSGGVHPNGRISTIQLHPGSSTRRDSGGSQRGKSPVETIDTLGCQWEWGRTLGGVRAENVNKHEFWNVFLGAKAQSPRKCLMGHLLAPVLLHIHVHSLPSQTGQTSK